MNGTHKAQGQRTGRITVPGFTERGVGQPGIHRLAIQRPRPSRGYCQAIQRQQQRQAGDLRQGTQAQRLEESDDHSQGERGTSESWVSVYDTARPQTQQSKLVRHHLANARLDAGDGHRAEWIYPFGVSENQFLIPNLWSRERNDSSRKWSRSQPHYSRKWGYAVIFGNFSTPHSGEYLDVAICREQISNDK